jgi:signal transduction histidine kinase
MSQKRLFLNFKSKIAISILAIGIVAVLIGLAVNYWVGRKQLQTAIGAQFSELTHETTQKLQFLIEASVEEAKLLAISSEIRNNVEESNRGYDESPLTVQEIGNRIEAFEGAWKPISVAESSEFLNQFLRDPSERAEHISIIVTDEKGFLVGADAKPKTNYFGDQPWWKAAYDKGHGRIYISDVDLIQQATGEFEQIYGLGLVVPVWNSTHTRAIGVLRTDLQVKRFFDAVIKVKIGKTDHTMLASSDGALIFCPIFLIRNHTLRSEFMGAIFQDRTGWAITEADVHYPGQSSINGFSPLRMTGNIHPESFGGKQWYVFTSQDPQESYAPINALQNRLAVSGVLGAVVLSFFGIYAAGFIVRPLENLKKGARLIGYGNLDHRLRITTGDEIQELADEFNEMAVKLKASYTGLEQKVAERTKELAVVNKINQIISSTLNLQLIFELLSEEVGKLLEYDQISITLLDAQHENIHTLFVKSRGGPLLVQGSTTYPKAGTATGLAIDQAQPFIRSSLSESQEFLEDRSAIRDGHQSYILVPIVSKQVTLGTLNLLSQRPKAYSKTNLEILVPIAEQLAIAIETISLFEETKMLDQLKSDFVSKVSHELRTPLTSIKGFTEILLTYNDVDSNTHREFLSIINEESERLTRLINDILDLSKIEAGKAEWQIQPISVSELADYVVKLFQSVAMEKNLPLRVDIPRGLPLVHGDWDQLLQVMDNLVSNAVKFTNSGEIVIQASK